jgi:hypothetical protein
MAGFNLPDAGICRNHSLSSLVRDNNQFPQPAGFTMTPDQLNLALAIQGAANQGFNHLAAALADMLRKQLKESK